MYPPIANPTTQAAAPKFGDKDPMRRSASTVTPPAQRQAEVAKLIDVSKCIGCKACQTASLEWNELREEIGAAFKTSAVRIDRPVGLILSCGLLGGQAAQSA